MIEKMKSSEVKFTGGIITVKSDEVYLENGNVAKRDVCMHPGGVCVLPIDDEQNVYLVKQFRYVFDSVIMEIPAGKFDKRAEDALECGKRELLEETGITASEMISLGQIYPSVGFLDEVIHIYLAKGLTFGEANPDEDEFVDVVKMPFSELLEMVMKNEVKDAKTVVAVLKTNELLKRG